MPTSTPRRQTYVTLCQIALVLLSFRFGRRPVVGQDPVNSKGPKLTSGSENHGIGLKCDVIPDSVMRGAASLTTGNLLFLC